jgi:hypothetical protein
MCSHSLNSLISRRYANCWSYVKSDYVWCSNCYWRIQNSVQLLPHATRSVTQSLTCACTRSRYCLLWRHRLWCKLPYRQKVSQLLLNTVVQCLQHRVWSSAKIRSGVDNTAAIWRNAPIHSLTTCRRNWTDSYGLTLKQVMFLQNYREKQLFVDTHEDTYQCHIRLL